jgi:hypothetical protein
VQSCGAALPLSGHYVVSVASTTYAPGIKTVTITIPDELDAEAAAEARRQGISKSELIRRGLAAVLPGNERTRSDDPWRDLAGFGTDGLTVAPGEIDDVVYNP